MNDPDQRYQARIAEARNIASLALRETDRQF